MTRPDPLGGARASDPDLQAWLGARRRPGNWFSIAADDEIPASVTGWERSLLSMFQIAFTPEIEQREKAGTLEADFFLKCAQLIQHESLPQQVRLNDEVQGVMRLDLETPPSGGSITLGDIDHMVSFDLIEDELDYGHFTLFWTGTTWKASFDFRNGRARAARFIDTALQFIAAARFSAGQGHANPAIDNLFSGCELLCKAQLILNHNQAARANSHGSVSSQINLQKKLGNGNPDFVQLFNRLSNARKPARYDASGEVQPPSASELDLAEQMGTALAKAVKQRGADA